MVRLEVPGHVLQHFWDLANVEAEVRRKSAVSLVNELKSAQDAHEPGENGADVEMGDADAGAGGGGVGLAGAGMKDADDGSGDGPALTGCSPVLVYALRRLARGLGSGRSGARQGFALALTAAFSEIPLVSLPDGLKLLKSSLEPITQSTKGAEARDILMGQLFGVAALVRAMAARLAAGETTEEDAVAFGTSVAEEVSALASSKAYLAESAAAVILELADAVGDSMTAVIDASPTLSAWLTTPAADAGPEVVLLCIRLWASLSPAARAKCDVLPEVDDDDAPAAAAKPAKGKKSSAKAGKTSTAKRWAAVFRKSHLEKIRDALMESSHSHPQVHTVWGELIEGAKGVPGALEALWDVEVENGLMISGSHQRRFLGFRLFAALLPEAEAEGVPALFSDGFTRCLLNNLNKPDNYLHAAAADCLDQIVSYAKADDTPSDVRLSVVAALQRLGPNRFDKISKKGAVQELLGGLSVDDASSYMRELMGIFVSSPAAEGGDEADADRAGGHLLGAKRRLWALEQAVGLWPRLPRDSQAELLKFLVLHAYYEADPDAAAPAPKKTPAKRGKKAAAAAAGGVVEEIGVAPLGDPADGLREACAVRASALLAANLKAQRAAAAAKAIGDEKNGDGDEKNGEKKKNKKVDAKAEKEPPADLLSAAAELCRRLDEEDSGAKLVDPMPEECEEVRARLFAALDKATKAGDDAPEVAAVAPLLRALAVLQVSDWREFTPAIEDLPRCVDDLLSPPKTKTKTKTKPKKTKKKAAAEEEEEEEEEEEPKPMDVLVDILLSLLAQPSALLRDVVEHTFKAVAPAVSEASVQDMLRVVMAPDADNRNAGGDESDDEALLEDAGDEEDEDDAEEEDDDDDVEVDEDDDDDEGDASDDDDEDGDSDEDSDEDGPVDEARAAAIAAALAKSGAAIDSDEEEDPAEDMDDDAMFSIDKLLGQAFKSRREDIKRKKNMVRATRDFKFRVLALIELYARTQPGSPWLPGAALPLLGAMQTALSAGTPQSTALAERIGGVLTKHVCHARDLPKGAGEAPVTAEAISSALESAIRAASRPAGGGDAKGFAKPATAVCLYLLRVLEAVTRRETGEEGEEASEAATSAYRVALETFRASKRCRLKSPFFQAAFDRHPSLAAALLPELAGLLEAGAHAESARGEFLRMEGAKLLANALSLGRRRSPAMAAAAKRRRETIGGAIAVAVAAPCRNRGNRADTAKSLLQCMEALGRLEPEGTPLSACLDADAILEAVKKQFKAPGMPPKGVSALTRACTLLGKEAPEATPAEPGSAGGGGGGGGGGKKKEGKKGGKKEGKKGGKGGDRAGAEKKEKEKGGGEKRKAPGGGDAGDGEPRKKKQRKGKAQREKEREMKKLAAAAGKD